MTASVSWCLRWSPSLQVAAVGDVLSQVCGHVPMSRVVVVDAGRAQLTGIDAQQVRAGLTAVREQWLAGAHGLSKSLMRLRGCASAGKLTSSMTQSWRTCLVHADTAQGLLDWLDLREVEGVASPVSLPRTVRASRCGAGA